MSRLSIERLLGHRIGIWVGYALVVLIWGTTWYGVQTQLNGTPPHVSAALRLGVASLLFFAIAALSGQSLRLTRRQWGLVVLQGACFFGFNYIAVYTAAQYLTSGVLAVIFSVTVPFNIIADRVISGTHTRISTVVAALTGVAGIALVFSNEFEQVKAIEHIWWGGLLAVLAAAVVAIGNVMAARFASAQIGALRLNAYGLAAGTVLILAWSWLSGASWSLNLTFEWFAGFAYLVVIGSVVAFGIYMKILPVVGPIGGAYVVVLSPVIALLISTVMEDLSLDLISGIGVILLLAGYWILLAQRH